MLAVQPDTMTVAAFLEWIADRDERHELVEGLPVRMMTGAKEAHNVVVGNVADAIRSVGKASGCRTTTSDTAIVTGPGHVRYPDVVVDCGPADPEALSASLPTIVVEVLSKSTSEIDLTDKLDEYRGIASMRAILVIDPDLVSVKVYKRSSSGEWVPERYGRMDQSIDLPPMGAVVSLAEIYDTLNPKARPAVEGVAKTSPGP